VFPFVRLLRLHYEYEARDSTPFSYEAVGISFSRSTSEWW